MRGRSAEVDRGGPTDVDGLELLGAVTRSAVEDGRDQLNLLSSGQGSRGCWGPVILFREAWMLSAPCSPIKPNPTLG